MFPPSGDALASRMAWRNEPGPASAVFVTTFTDVIGFVLFLGLAAVFVDHLV